MEIKPILEKAIEAYSIKLRPQQYSQLELYYQLLLQWNEKINLTAITDPQGVAVKHFADSLAFFYFFTVPEGASVIDVGTGAGFPGVVLKIARPDIRLTLLDSLNKRFLFLRELMAQLGLDATFVPGRAEELGQEIDCREGYDFAVSRAVAQLNILSEYCLPFVRLSGRFVAFKGGDCAEEVARAKQAIAILGGKLSEVHAFELPLGGGSRSLVVAEKVRPTPDKYPRNNGRIKSKPL